MIGVFGGSGFYSLLTDVRTERVETPYGEPSGDFALGSVDGVEVAFLPRHGARHTIPPAQINYRANLWAMQKLGVTQVLAPTAAGSLQAGIRPGDFVVCDQFVDRTHGRADTFFTGPRVAHVSTADPYCQRLRQLAVEIGRELGVTMHDGGTVVVVNGPRFSSRAESRWFAAQGWEVVNMTQYPELVLARELELCYLNIALITDYDAGLEGRPEIAPVTVAGVEQVFKSNNERVRELILGLIPRLADGNRDCLCPTAMKHAFIS
ncbi:MAG TPA: S-methyl-5'-thioadenosine phosphorylase [Candidatus Dormibacteraeota bacterium]|nr:S-methyl-5'-thioadenosine phosphorylase [Candidatus Dormibacteraeota bacterium]